MSVLLEKRGAGEVSRGELHHSKSTNGGPYGVFRNLSAVDCVLLPRFFLAGNMGVLPKRFAIENACIPYTTGSADWRAVGRTNGPLVEILHDSAKWLDSSNYSLAITNLWVGGARMDAVPADKVRNGDRIALSVAGVLEKPAIPAVPDRHAVGWTCPWKVYVGRALQRDVRRVSRKAGEQRIGQPDDGENLLEDRPSTRSAWQRCPSWLVKLDATEMDGASRVYRLRQCERGAGMLNVVTDAYLRHGNGTYRLSFEARAKGERAVAFEAHFLSNEGLKVARFSVPSDGEWHAFSDAIELDFDLSVTELAALQFKVLAPTDELWFKNLALAK